MLLGFIPRLTTTVGWEHLGVSQLVKRLTRFQRRSWSHTRLYADSTQPSGDSHSPPLRPSLTHVCIFSIFTEVWTNANRVLIHLPFGFSWICIVNVTNLPFNLENIPQKHSGPSFSSLVGNLSLVLSTSQSLYENYVVYYAESSEKYKELYFPVWELLIENSTFYQDRYST